MWYRIAGSSVPTGARIPELPLCPAGALGEGGADRCSAEPGGSGGVRLRRAACGLVGGGGAVRRVDILNTGCFPVASRLGRSYPAAARLCTAIPSASLPSGLPSARLD